MNLSIQQADATGKIAFNNSVWNLSSRFTVMESATGSPDGNITIGDLAKMHDEGFLFWKHCACSCFGIWEAPILYNIYTDVWLKKLVSRAPYAIKSKRNKLIHNYIND